MSAKLGIALIAVLSIGLAAIGGLAAARFADNGDAPASALRDQEEPAQGIDGPPVTRRAPTSP